MVLIHNEKIFSSALPSVFFINQKLQLEGDSFNMIKFIYLAQQCFTLCMDLLFPYLSQILMRHRISTSLLSTWILKYFTASWHEKIEFQVKNRKEKFCHSYEYCDSFYHGSGRQSRSVLVVSNTKVSACSSSFSWAVTDYMLLDFTVFNLNVRELLYLNWATDQSGLVLHAYSTKRIIHTLTCC